MIDIDIARQSVAELNKKIDEASKSLGIDSTKEKLAELNAEMNSQDFWNDIQRSTKVNKQIKYLETKLNRVKALNEDVENIVAMLDLLQEEHDEDISNEASKFLQNMQKNVEELELETLLSGEYDSSNAVLSLHAGAGGTEAQDWTQMLFRMYSRFCESMGYTVKILDFLDGDEAGIKSVTMQVSGDNAYGFLRSEKGVHRLVRISPFDSNARRHTSFSSLDVSPMLENIEFDLDMDDVRIDTYRSSGAGGQHVNKTDSAVRMTHIPSGIVVQCQNERSQIQNREVCLNLLKSRLLELQEREKEEKMIEIKGEMKKIEWGSQIRSYIFQPYTLVKDHRTNFESGNIEDVMNGEIEDFIRAYLRMQ